MNSETVIISAIVGILTSIITAYITTRFKMKEEKEKWRREFAIKFAEAQTEDNLRRASVVESPKTPINNVHQENAETKTKDDLPSQPFNNSRAQQIAIQFAIGVLIKNPDTEERERIFVPPNCRLVAGRDKNNSIPTTDDHGTSRQHCSFSADDKNVYIEDLGAGNGSIINGIRLARLGERHKLETGDIIKIGLDTEFHYRKLVN